MIAVRATLGASHKRPNLGGNLTDKPAAKVARSTETGEAPA